MASIIHESSELTESGAALIGQSLARQPNGLVDVSLDYVLARDREQGVLAEFTIDSSPPIFPDIIARDELQTRDLYLQNYTAERSGGIMTVRAQYVGALLRGLETPYQTNGYETGLLQIRNIAYEYAPTPAMISGAVPAPLFNDIYEFTYRARVAYYETAYRPSIDIVTVKSPELISKPGQDGLIVGWNISRAEFAGSPTNVSFTLAPGYFRREWTSEQWLEFLMVEMQKQQSPGLRPTVVTSSEIENVSPAINIFKLRARLFMPKYPVQI